MQPTQTDRTITFTTQTASITRGASAANIAAASGTTVATYTKVSGLVVPFASQGWQPVAIGYCYTVTDTYTKYNYLGWKIYTASLQTYNWCPNGAQDGSGLWSATINAHGYGARGYCGHDGIQSGYIAPNQWGWQALVTFKFGFSGPPWCNAESPISIWDQFWGNGHWNWNDNG